ncbi:MAG: Ig-like domain-containing protein [Acetobacter sp.]|nr:Ig-like domain-containing protein [Bacteroides sp.]MCM1340716.1 Ig-like domain-containing protein [Acetobacter sp.]MCM1433054.1 Ig-like domain-containing protein [Clostridiales bacterium]
MKKCKILLCIFLVIIVLGTVIPAYAASSPSLNTSSVSIIVGESQNIYMRNTKGKKITSGVTWKTSNKSVITVSKGKIKANATGNATITAKYKKKTYKCKVTVKKAKQKVTKKTLYLGEKYTQSLKNAKNKTIDASKIKWSSSNTSVATVSSKGIIKAIKNGKTNITAKYKGKKYVSTFTVGNSVSSSTTNSTFGVNDTKKVIKLTMKNGNTLKLKFISGENLVNYSWGNWKGNDTKLTLTKVNDNSTGTVKIKFYCKEYPQNYVIVTVNIESKYKLVVKNKLPDIVYSYEKGTTLNPSGMSEAVMINKVTTTNSGTTMCIDVEFQAYDSIYKEGNYSAFYRILDSNGYVVKASSIISERMYIGDKSKAKIYLFDMKPGTYTIEFIDHYAK